MEAVANLSPDSQIWVSVIWEQFRVQGLSSPCESSLVNRLAYSFVKLSFLAFEKHWLPTHVLSRIEGFSIVLSNSGPWFAHITNVDYARDTPKNFMNYLTERITDGFLEHILILRWGRITPFQFAPPCWGFWLLMLILCNSKTYQMIDMQKDITRRSWGFGVSCHLIIEHLVLSWDITCSSCLQAIF